MKISHATKQVALRAEDVSGVAKATQEFFEKGGKVSSYIPHWGWFNTRKDHWTKYKTFSDRADQVGYMPHYKVELAQDEFPQSIVRCFYVKHIHDGHAGMDAWQEVYWVFCPWTSFLAKCEKENAEKEKRRVDCVAYLKSLETLEFEMESVNNIPCVDGRFWLIRARIKGDTGAYRPWRRNFFRKDQPIDPSAYYCNRPSSKSVESAEADLKDCLREFFIDAGINPAAMKLPVIIR